MIGRTITAGLLWLLCTVTTGCSFGPRYAPPTKWITIVVAGDSIAAGFSAGRADATLVYRLALLRPTWLINNYSCGGASMGPYGPRQGLSASGFTQLWPQVVVVMLGANDFGNSVPLPSFQKFYENFLAMARAYYHPIIVCVTPLWRENEFLLNENRNTIQEYRDVITSVCGSRGADVVDGRWLVPSGRRYFTDAPQIHPNADGYAILARNLAAELDQYMPNPMKLSGRHTPRQPPH